jgi:hypothetical protein
MMGMIGGIELLLFFGISILIIVGIVFAIGFVSKSAKEKKMAPGEVADEIKKLAELHEQGILTDDEFAEQKKKVLGKSEEKEVKYVGEKKGVLSFCIGVLVGFIAMIILSFIPILGPIFAGLVAGIIAGGGAGRGAGAGFLSGIIGPLVGVGLLGLGGGILGGWLGGLIGGAIGMLLIIASLVYAILGLIGGAVGGIIRK